MWMNYSLSLICSIGSQTGTRCSLIKWQPAWCGVTRGPWLCQAFMNAETWQIWSLSSAHDLQWPRRREDTNVWESPTPFLPLLLFSMWKNLRFSRVFLHRHRNKVGNVVPYKKKKTQGSFSIKLLTLKRDIAVIDSVLMVWGGILALCAVRMWFFNRTLKIKTNCGKQLCICLWVELQEQYFSNYISSVFPGVSEKIILYYLKYFTGSVVKQY